MIDHVKPTTNDTFIDLGSGVGQVVLTMAALAQCKVVLGIEKEEFPSRYAKVRTLFTPIDNFT